MAPGLRGDEHRRDVGTQGLELPVHVGATGRDVGQVLTDRDGLAHRQALRSIAAIARPRRSAWTGSLLGRA